MRYLIVAVEYIHTHARTHFNSLYFTLSYSLTFHYLVLLLSYDTAIGILILILTGKLRTILYSRTRTQDLTLSSSFATVTATTTWERKYGKKSEIGTRSKTPDILRKKDLTSKPKERRRTRIQK